MTSRCILVTGSRGWTDAHTLTQALGDAARQAAADGVTELTIRHGACYPRIDPEHGIRPYESADWLTHLWIARFGGTYPGLTIVEQERPADWTARCRPTCHTKPRRGQPDRDHRRRRPDGTSTCPAAGNYRNLDMIREHPQPYQGIAFQIGASTGTGHCIRSMREQSIPVITPPARTGHP